MPIKTAELAERLVVLAARSTLEMWSNTFKLVPEEEQLLLDVVSVGSKNVSIVAEKLFSHERDQDGSQTGKKLPVNLYCPYKVVTQKGENHFPATHWLETILRLARKDDVSRGELVLLVQKEIERSIPLEPIKLTVAGDFLYEYPPGGFDHTRDSHRLGSCVGVHDCGGWMDKIDVTPSYSVLYCRQCHLRVSIPSGIETYGDLRRSMGDSRPKPE